MTDGTADRERRERAGHYRIGAVARATGLTTHTIRVWERRYQALAPVRTPGGDRLYAEADVARLRLLKALQAKGHAIGTIARLPTAELEALAAPPASGGEPPAGEMPLDAMRTGFLQAIATLDVAAADRLLATATATLAPRTLVYAFLAPVLEEVGARWERGELAVAHEHAASALIRNHIAVVMRVYGPARQGRTTLVATPAGELHEFGALLVAILAAVSGWDVVYLGPNLPAGEIAQAARQSHAQAVMLSWVYADSEDTRAELERLRAALPATVRMIVGGRAAREAEALPAAAERMPELPTLEAYLRE